jgi:hypothetical protein
MPLAEAQFDSRSSMRGLTHDTGGMHGVRFRRLSGDIWKYKEKIAKIQGMLKL